MSNEAIAVLSSGLGYVSFYIPVITSTVEVESGVIISTAVFIIVRNVLSLKLTTYKGDISPIS